MKRLGFILIVALGLAGVAGIYVYRQKLGLLGPSGSGAAGSSSADLSSASSASSQMAWQTIDRSQDGFSVELPAATKEIQISASNQTGGTSPVNMILSNPSADIAFSVAWADNPPVVEANGREPDRVLDMARDEALDRTQTTLVSETRKSPGGFPAREVVARNAGGGILDTRLILAGQRLYMLTAVFPSMNARREEDVTRFYNSFTALTPKTRSETAPPAPASKSDQGPV